MLAAGRLLLSSSDDKTVKLWDTRGARACVRTFYDHTDVVNAAAFNPDATCIASASSDGTAKLWDLRTQQLLQHYDAHEEAVTDLSFHSSGSYLLTSSVDATLKAWDLVEGRLFCTLHGHEGAVNACAFSPDGDFFSSCGVDMQAMVWRTNIGGSSPPAVTAAAATLPAPATLPKPTRAPPPPPAASAVPPPSAKAPPPPPPPAPEWGPTPGLQSALGEPTSAGSASLASTLESVVGQLDILAQTVALLEQRLTVGEERTLKLEGLLQEVADGQRGVLAAVGASAL